MKSKTPIFQDLLNNLSPNGSGFFAAACVFSLIASTLAIVCSMSSSAKLKGRDEA